MTRVRWLLLLGSIAACIAEGPNELMRRGVGVATTPVIGWLETRDGLQSVSVSDIDAGHGVFEDLERLRAGALDARYWPVEATASDEESR